MDMELGLGTEEQVVGLSNNDATHIIAKGKRTKRLRLLSPGGVAAAATVMTSSCSSASGDRDSSGGGGGGSVDYGSFSSASITYESTDQEEEDMANCLILLAQGKGGGGYDDDDHHHHHHHKHKQQVEDHDHHGDGNKTEKGSTSSRKFAEMATATATATATKVGFYIYECKTCNRTFPSFQALGGHRASHKRPKITAAEEKKLPPPAPLPQQPPPPPPSSQPQLVANYDQLIEEGGQAHIKSGPPISLQLGSHGHRAFHGNKATKIHECSICGSEFTSGQALGGHMRRHRASTNATTTQVVGMMSSTDTISCNATAVAAAAAAVEVEVQPRNILELDLNLPAPPEDDLRESKFQFTAASQRSMVLSAAPALVDCHY